MVRLLDLGVLLLASRAWGIPRPPVGSWRRALPAATGAALSFGLMLGVLGLLWGWGDLGRMITGGARPDDALPERMLFAGIAMVLLGPLAEEAVFRGVLLPALRARMPDAAAILVSALLFAGAHALLDPGLLPVSQLAGGLAFAWLAVRTEGLLAPFLLHAAANGFVLALQVWRAH